MTLSVGQSQPRSGGPLKLPTINKAWYSIRHDTVYQHPLCSQGVIPTNDEIPIKKKHKGLNKSGILRLPKLGKLAVISTARQEQSSRVLRSIRAIGSSTANEKASLFLPPPLDRVWRSLPSKCKPSPEVVLRKVSDCKLSVRDAMAEVLLGDAKSVKTFCGKLKQLLEESEIGVINAKSIFELMPDYGPQCLAGTVLVPQGDIEMFEYEKGSELLPTGSMLMVTALLPGIRQLCLLGGSGAIDFSALRGCSTLQDLNLTGCELRKDLPIAVEGCTSLRTLALSGTGEARLVSLDAPALQRLNLSGHGGLGDLSALRAVPTLLSLRLRHCSGLRDISPLSALVNLETLDFGHCESLEDISPLSHCPRLRWLCLHGCGMLSAEAAADMWQHMESAFATASAFVWPSRSLCDAFAEMMGATEQDMRILKASGRRAAQQELNLLVDTYSDDGLFAFEDLEASVDYAASWDIPRRKLGAAVAKLEIPSENTKQLTKDALVAGMQSIMSANQEFHAEAAAEFFCFLDAQQKGYLIEEDMKSLANGGPASLEALCELRDFLLTKFGTLKSAFEQIRRASAGQDKVSISEPKRLSMQGNPIGGNATSRRGSELTSPSARQSIILHAEQVEITEEDEEETVGINVEDWCTGLKNLGWTGPLRPSFVSLDSETRDGEISFREAKALHLYESAYRILTIERLAKWFIEKHGGLREAYQAIDTSRPAGSETDITLEDIRSFCERNGHPEPQRAAEAIGLLDFDGSGSFSKVEFETLASFSASFVLGRLRLLGETISLIFGDLEQGFEAIAEASNPTTASKRQQHGRKLSKLKIGHGSQVESSGPLTLKQFDRGLQALKLPGVLDHGEWNHGCGIRRPARLLFRFFDYDSSGSLAREEWIDLLRCFCVEAACEGVTHAIKALDIALEGKLEDSFQAIYDAAEAAGFSEGQATITKISQTRKASKSDNKNGISAQGTLAQVVDTMKRPCPVCRCPW